MKIRTKPGKKPRYRINLRSFGLGASLKFEKIFDFYIKQWYIRDSETLLTKKS